MNGTGNLMISSSRMAPRGARMTHVCIQVRRMENGCTFPYTLMTYSVIVAATKDCMFKEFEKRMGHILNIKNLGDLKYYLGIQFERDENGIFLLHQKGYIERKLDKFNLTDSRPSNIPVNPGYQKRQEVQEEAKNKEIYRNAIG